MGLLDGKVALITGGARGQGRAHAVRLAEEGADIIVCDIADQIDTVPYDLATEDDLNQTVEQVEEHDRRCVSVKADAADADQINGVVQRGIEEFDKIDILVVNHGIAGYAPTWELTEQQWDDMLRVNLKGVWLTAKAVAPHLIERGEGGAMVLTSSAVGLVGTANAGHYVAAKHGVIGLMRTLAVELAPHNVRVNAVCPGVVNTPMVHNQGTYEMFTGGQEGATFEDAKPAFEALHKLPLAQLEPVDISNAVLYLVSDLGRYVTGVALPVDAGFVMK